MGKYKKIIAVLLLLFELDIQVFAGGAAFLEKGMGARPRGMGSAFVSVADDSHAVLWNPAGLSQLSQSEISSSFANLYGITYQQFSFIKPSDWGRIGVSYVSAGLGGIPFTALDSNARPAAAGAAFEYGASAYFLSYANNIFDLSFGVNLKLIRENLQNNSASGYGADIGALYQVNSNFAIGLSVLNVLKPNLRWNTASAATDVVPTRFKLGSAYRILDNNLLLALDLSYQPGRAVKYHLGGEYSPHEILALRAGLDEGAISFGTGIRYGGLVNVDYAYTYNTQDYLENTHRLSLGFRFGQEQPAFKKAKPEPPSKMEKRAARGSMVRSLSELFNFGITKLVEKLPFFNSWATKSKAARVWPADGKIELEPIFLPGKMKLVFYPPSGLPPERATAVINGKKVRLRSVDDGVRDSWEADFNLPKDLSSLDKIKVYFVGLHNQRLFLSSRKFEVAQVSASLKNFRQARVWPAEGEITVERAGNKDGWRVKFYPPLDIIPARVSAIVGEQRIILEQTPDAWEGVFALNNQTNFPARIKVYFVEAKAKLLYMTVKPLFYPSNFALNF